MSADRFSFCWERGSRCCFCDPPEKNERNEIPREEIAAFVRDIDAGVISVAFIPDEHHKTPRDVYCGTTSYRASNGWRVDVFNDCDSFDYIEEIEAVDGRITDASWLLEYRPAEDVSERIWGLP